MRRLLCLLCLLFVGACSSAPQGIESDGPRVGEVVVALPEAEPRAETTEDLTREDVIEAYSRVEPAADKDEARAIERRLADLEMRVGEDRAAVGDPAPYRAAISRYEALLEESDARDSDEIVYRLARAYDAIGDRAGSQRNFDALISGYPHSPYMLEAHFRRAENAFSADQFVEAADDYSYVVNQGESTAYWENANYMLGWCRFKQSRYEESLDNFFVAIDTILNNNLAGELDLASRELLDDALRAIAMAVTYLDGVTTIAAQMDKWHKPVWQHLVYQRLADEFLAKERYLDSVSALDAFVVENPLAPRSPAVAQQTVEILTDAGFVEEATRHKESFIIRFGVASEFWSVHAESGHAAYVAALRNYLLEVAKRWHRQGQEEGRSRAFLIAASYYEQLLATSPAKSVTAEALFLQGEAYTEVDEPVLAVDAYQTMFREHGGDARAADAAYAAMLALSMLMESAPPDRLGLAEQVKIDAQIEYATTFPDAPHARAVQADAANALFKLEQYEQAVELAEGLLGRNDLSPEIEHTAILVIAHSAFDAGDFAVAEAGYRAALSVAGVAPDLAGADRARLVATIYKLGEAEERLGNIDAAVAHYLRIASEDADSALAEQGHFDAVAVLESQDRWADAATLLSDFRSSYADSPLAVDATGRLAVLLEKSGQQASAAAEYRRMMSDEADVAIRQQALFHAGELYLEIQDPINAVACFRLYVDTFPSPADLTLEAAHQLDTIYQELGNSEMRQVWLTKKIEIAASSDLAMTDRGRFLSAEAQFALAEYARESFDRIDLTAPLRASLKRKQQALTQAVSGYEGAASHGIAEFSTASTFRIADTYIALATALLESARPSGLSELELEQYQLLLEEQALPFEEQAIALHEINVRRSWEGQHDQWIEKSFEALRGLLPARFDKQEAQVGFVDSVF